MVSYQNYLSDEYKYRSLNETEVEKKNNMKLLLMTVTK